jgi:hypothetical protein
MTDEWLDFIVSCRSGKVHNYDIVEGPMADDTIFNYVQSFIDGKITRDAFWSLAKFKYPTHQISFHTISAQIMTYSAVRNYDACFAERANLDHLKWSAVNVIGMQSQWSYELRGDTLITFELDQNNVLPDTGTIYTSKSANGIYGTWTSLPDVYVRSTNTIIHYDLSYWASLYQITISKDSLEMVLYDPLLESSIDYSKSMLREQIYNRIIYGKGMVLMSRVFVNETADSLSKFNKKISSEKNFSSKPSISGDSITYNNTLYVVEVKKAQELHSGAYDMAIDISANGTTCKGKGFIDYYPGNDLCKDENKDNFDIIPYLDVDSNLVYLAEPYFEADPDFQDCLEKIMPLKEDDKPSKVRSAAATYKTRHLNFFRKNVGN